MMKGEKAPSAGNTSGDNTSGKISFEEFASRVMGNKQETSAKTPNGGAKKSGNEIPFEDFANRVMGRERTREENQATGQKVEKAMGNSVGSTPEAQKAAEKQEVIEKAKKKKGLRAFLVSAFAVGILVIGLTVVPWGGKDRNKQPYQDPQAIEYYDENAESLFGFEKLDALIDGSFEQDDNPGCYEDLNKISPTSIGNPRAVAEYVGIDYDNATPEEKGEIFKYLSKSMKYPAGIEAIAFKYPGFENLEPVEAEQRIAQMSDIEKANLQDFLDKKLGEDATYHEEKGNGRYYNQGAGGNPRHSVFGEADLTGKDILVCETALDGGPGGGPKAKLYIKGDCDNLVAIIVTDPNGTETTYYYEPNSTPGQSTEIETTPYHEEETTPYHEEETTPYHEEETTPYHEEETTPYHEEETTPYHEEETTPYHEEETTPYHEEETTPAPKNQQEANENSGADIGIVTPEKQERPVTEEPTADQSHEYNPDTNTYNYTPVEQAAQIGYEVVNDINEVKQEPTIITAPEEVVAAETMVENKTAPEMVTGTMEGAEGQAGEANNFDAGATIGTGEVTGNTESADGSGNTIQENLDNATGNQEANPTGDYSEGF